MSPHHKASLRSPLHSCNTRHAAFCAMCRPEHMCVTALASTTAGSVAAAESWIRSRMSPIAGAQHNQMVHQMLRACHLPTALTPTSMTLCASLIVLQNQAQLLCPSDVNQLVAYINVRDVGCKGCWHASGMCHWGWHSGSRGLGCRMCMKWAGGRKLKFPNLLSP